MSTVGSSLALIKTYNPTRVCSCCHKELPLTSDFFARRKADGVYGRQDMCRICDRKRVKERYQFCKSSDAQISRLKKYRISPKGRYAQYKNCAKQRGVKFNLTMTEFMSFWKKPCEYCGDIVKNIGLDQLKPGEGYIN